MILRNVDAGISHSFDLIEIVKDYHSKVWINFDNINL